MVKEISKHLVKEIVKHEHEAEEIEEFREEGNIKKDTLILYIKAMGITLTVLYVIFMLAS